MKNKLISISIILMLIFISTISVEAIAPTPRVELDEYELTVTSTSNINISGTCSVCVGQLVGIYDSTGIILYNYSILPNTNSSSSFTIKVPARFLNEGKNTFKVKSLPANGIINGSNPKTLTITVKNTTVNKKNQIITASNLELKVNDTKNINAKVSSNLTLSYISDNASIATVDPKGNVIGRKVGTAHITIIQAGNNEYNATSKVITVTVKDNTITPTPTPTKPNTYTIVYHGGSNIGGSDVTGKMKTQEVSRDKTITLYKNSFKKKDYVFVGWATKEGIASRNNSKHIEKFSNINMTHFQLGCVKKVRKPSAVGNGKTWSQLKDSEKQYLTDGAKVKNLAKKGETIHLYAVWKGCGPQAAVDWGRIIAADNNFNYGEHYQSNWRGTGNDRSHRIGCYFCGTNRQQPRGKYHGKAAKKWDTSKSFSEQSTDQKYDKTYCCNPFIVACYAHGANEYGKCHGGSMSYDSWTGHNGKGKFKKKLKSAALQPGDVFFSRGHVWMYAGKLKDKNGKKHHYILEASGISWKNSSIHLKQDSNPASGAKGAVRYTKKSSSKYSITNKEKN